MIVEHWSYDKEGSANKCPINKIPGTPEYCAGHIFENNIPSFQEKYKDVRFISDI